MARGATSLDPNALSESATLGQAIDLLTSGNITSSKLAKVVDLLYALQRQAKAGVHKNPIMTKAEVLAFMERQHDLTIAALEPYAGSPEMSQIISRLTADYKQARAQVESRSGSFNVVSRNPLLTILGNPLSKGKALQAGELLSRNVQAVLYLHDQDHLPYAHGFGDADITLKTHRDGAVTIGGLQDHTGVAMMGLKGGEILLFDEKEMPF
jgi:hypothetical protein